MLLFLDDSQTRLRASPARLRDHFYVWLRASRFDHALAEFASPDSSKELALRAKSLARRGERISLARSVDRLVKAADPSCGRRVGAPICADRIRDASAEFGTLIDRLLCPGPVSVHGVAQLRTLLADGGAPLYHRGSSDDLALRMQEIVETLDPRP